MVTNVFIAVNHPAPMHRVVVPMPGTMVMGDVPATVKTRVMTVVIIDHHHAPVVPVEGTEEKAGRHIHTRTPIKTADKYVMTGVVPVDGWII